MLLSAYGNFLLRIAGVSQVMPGKRGVDQGQSADAPYEHQQDDGEFITDSCLLIGRKMYHIECQSTDDMTMVIWMIEYDFAISIEHAEKQGRRYRIEFPKSCVLFLRSSENTPDYLEAEVAFPDGKVHLYSIPTKKKADYTKASNFEKTLLMLLPF